MGGLGPGVQTGDCADTGGGWASVCLAHHSQLYAVPDGLSDRAASLLDRLPAPYTPSNVAWRMRDGFSASSPGGGRRGRWAC